MKLVDKPGPKWELHDLNNPEWDLFESLIVEQNDIKGFECLYYRYDKDKTMDTLYGEDQTSKLHPPKRTKISYDPVEVVRVADMFGLMNDESLSWMQFPKYTFKRDVLEDLDGVDAPMPGDVLYLYWNEMAYEVVDVSEELNTFQARKFCYELRVKPFRYSQQDASAEEVVTEMLDTPEVSAWGDNNWIEEESNKIDNYGNIDEKIYGY